MIVLTTERSPALRYVRQRLRQASNLFRLPLSARVFSAILFFVLGYALHSPATVTAQGSTDVPTDAIDMCEHSEGTLAYLSHDAITEIDTVYVRQLSADQP